MFQRSLTANCPRFSFSFRHNLSFKSSSKRSLISGSKRSLSLSRFLPPAFALSLKHQRLALETHFADSPPRRLVPQASAATFNRMAEATSVMLYNDSLDDFSSTQQMLVFDESPNLGFPELQAFAGHGSGNPAPMPQPGTENRMLNPLDNWDVYDVSEPGPSGVPGGGNGGFPESFNTGFGDPIELSVWPVQPGPYSCTCCQVLREITHTNGILVTKLEIHGRLGIICHAVLEKYGIDWSIKQEYQMLDFCKESIASVKQFLVGYCEERKQEGYIMLQDPLLLFYEALCVGLCSTGNDGSLDADDFSIHSPISNSGEFHMNPPEVMAQAPPADDRDSVRHNITRRGALSAQRERTGRLTIRDLKAFFHFPIEVAAKKMKICPTVIKKICRRHGLFRWPYRKIKSIERKISEKTVSLNSDDIEERLTAEAEIQRLQQELSFFNNL